MYMYMYMYIYMYIYMYMYMYIGQLFKFPKLNKGSNFIK